MAETNLRVEIISPEKVLFEGNCEIALIPSINGEIGIMADHEMIITKLIAGKISLLIDEKSIADFEITTGYGKIQSANHLLLIVEQG